MAGSEHASIVDNRVRHGVHTIESSLVCRLFLPAGGHLLVADGCCGGGERNRSLCKSGGMMEVVARR